jgi:hypothetical protein
MSFEIGEEVRVKALLERRRWERHAPRASREPAIGDVGLIVDVDASNDKRLYTVECTGDGGVERWLSHFSDDELERLPGT